MWTGGEVERMRVCALTRLKMREHARKDMRLHAQPHRFYHSVAMLLPSGDVWVAGSEQGESPFSQRRSERLQSRARALMSLEPLNNASAPACLCFVALCCTCALRTHSSFSARPVVGVEPLLSALSTTCHLLTHPLTHPCHPFCHPPGDCVDTCKEGGTAPADQEYRAELFQLPYAFMDRPAITKLSTTKVG